MTTTIDLPADLVREIERRAAGQGQNLDQAVTELLRRGLKAPAAIEIVPQPTIRTHPKTGLPYIECAHGSDELTPQRVAEILLEQEVNRHDEAR